MKKFSKLFISLLAAGSLASCSSDNFDGPVTPQPGEADGVNMKLTISLPVSGGTRAAGDPGERVGEEVGQDWENNVGKVLILLTDLEDNLITHDTSDTQKDNDIVYSDDQSKFTMTSTFNASALVNYINKNYATSDQAPVRVYAFCNPTEDLLSKLEVGKNGWRDAVCTITTSDPLGRKNNDGELFYKETKDIPMANEVVVNTNLPNKTEILKGTYAKATNAYPMGTVNVIRSIARFDYKAKQTDNKYDITVTTPTSDGTTTGKMQIQLTHMALVNMSNNFYYLHRTSKNSKIEYCGADARDSYIVDSDWEWKDKWNKDIDCASNFLFPLYKDKTFNVNAWSRIELTKLTDEDDDENWNIEGKDKTGYHIWRYVTENSIPSPTSKQKNGISTGVVFRGVMTTTDETPAALKKAIDEDHNKIYVFNGIIYASWNEVKTTSERTDMAKSDLKKAYDACNSATDPALATAAAQGFTVFEYNESYGGYVTLYYYWNRHWDNGEYGVMADMEFAVVRNNVYKLTVEDISGLGRPRNPEGDPDPVDPDDPDEKNDVNIKLSCQIKKWTVRANGIHL